MDEFEKRAKSIALASNSMEDLVERITKHLRQVRVETIAECAKIADEEGQTNVENPAIDFVEHARRQGIRWCGEWTARKIRALLAGPGKESSDGKK